MAETWSMEAWRRMVKLWMEERRREEEWSIIKWRIIMKRRMIEWKMDVMRMFYVWLYEVCIIDVRRILKCRILM